LGPHGCGVARSTQEPGPFTHGPLEDPSPWETLTNTGRIWLAAQGTHALSLAVVRPVSSLKPLGQQTKAHLVSPGTKMLGLKVYIALHPAGYTPTAKLKDQSTVH
jgi:hypothetical protein